VIVGSAVVALLAVGGLVAALLLNNGDRDKGGSGDAGSSSSPSASVVAGHRGPDTTRTIKTTECTEPKESYNDEEKELMPNFVYKDWTSVLGCLQAAGWKYDKNAVDENTFGQDTVMRQSPKAGTEFDPEDPPTIQFDISTGNPSQ